MMRRLLFNNRTLIFLHASESEAIAKIDEPFAVLLAAEADNLKNGQQKIIDMSIANGCVEFCCIGKDSEALHDKIDSILEDKNFINIVTTWHADEPLEDALYYFLNLAGSKAPTLVAVIDGADNLQNALEEAILKDY